MVIPLVILLLVVVSPTAAITLDTDGGIGVDGDGGLGLGFIVAPLIGLAVLAAIAGSINTGDTAVPGATRIMKPVPTPTICPICPAVTVCPTCPAMTVCPTPLTPCNPMPACPANYQRIGIPPGVPGAVLQSCYRVKTAPALNFRGAAQLCDADNAVPVEFNTAGESEAVAVLIAGTTGMLFTGHTDAFNTLPAANMIIGINSGVLAVSGVAFPVIVNTNIDCGVIRSGVNPGIQQCSAPVATGVVCEISLGASTCFCPAGTG